MSAERLTTRVFLNPAAGRGRAARVWPSIRAGLEVRLGSLDVVVSTGPGHLTQLARTAVGEGIRRFIAVGGDGTVNEVLNGILDPRRHLLAPDCVPCPIPAGTANELCRALGHLRHPDAALDAAMCATTRPVDLTVNICRSLDGTANVQRFGYLVTSFGAAAQISHDTSQSRFLKRLGGRFSYFAVTLIVTLTFRHREMRLTVDGGPPQVRTIYTGLCCSTENAGGGMKLAPGARFDDGMLDYVEFGNITRRQILLQRPSWLFEGRHIAHPTVRRLAVRHLRVECDVDTLVDVDGETIGRLPLDVTVVRHGFAVGG